MSVFLLCQSCQPLPFNAGNISKKTARGSSKCWHDEVDDNADSNKNIPSTKHKIPQNIPVETVWWEDEYGENDEFLTSVAVWKIMCTRMQRYI